MSTAPSDVPNIYVINLDRTPERLSKFMMHNGNTGLTFSRFSAIDGKDIDREQLVSSGAITADLVFTNNSVACALSHMNIWNIAVNKKETVTICEDDAIIHHNFASTYHNAINSTDGFDIIYWGYNHDMHIAYDINGLGLATTILDRHIFSNDLNIGHFQKSIFSSACYRARRVYGALCYTITPSGAKRLLELCSPLKNEQGSYILDIGLDSSLLIGSESLGIDVHIGVAALPSILGYVVVPPVVISPNDKKISTNGKERKVTAPG